MKRTVRLSSAGTQMVRDMLNSKLLQAFMIACVVFYAVQTVALITQETDLISSLFLILTQGFVAAEALMLWQRKESRNLRHLAVFCLLGAIVMLLLCMFLAAVVMSLNMEFSAQTEEILQLWTETNMDAGMPYMIVTVVSVGLTGLSLLFLWLALRMSADMLERKGSARNWYLAAAIFLFLSWALALGMLVAQPAESWIAIVVNTLSLFRNGTLALLMGKAAMEYRAKLG